VLSVAKSGYFQRLSEPRFTLPLTINQESGFELQPPNTSGLLSLELAAKSCGVSRQAFHAWSVEPARVDGSRKLFDLASIIRNRLEAERAARTPADQESERLAARLALLRERIERERIATAEALARYCDRPEAETALAAVLDAAASILEGLPARLAHDFPEIEPARALVDREIVKAAAALRSATLDDSPKRPAPEPETLALHHDSAP